MVRISKRNRQIIVDVVDSIISSFVFKDHIFLLLKIVGYRYVLVPFVQIVSDVLRMYCLESP